MKYININTMIKPEIDLELSIKALEVYNVEPAIIKSMLSNLQKVVKQNCNLQNVSNRRELFDKFYEWLDGLSQTEYDDMSLTDKCEKFFFKT